MTRIVRRAMTVGLLALTLGVGAADAAAQARGSRGAVIGYVAAGVSGLGTGELDDRLAARGYPTFGRTAAAVAIGAYLLLDGGVMLGGEWNGLITDAQTHQGRDVGLGGGYGTLGVGYSVALSPRVRVYPRLGLGGGGMGLWVERDGDAVGFDEALADPELYGAPDSGGGTGSELIMNRDGAVLDLGGGAEFLPGGWGRGLLIGLRLGYLVAPFSGDWRLDERQVTGGPASTIGGPYIRVVIGGGPRW